MSKDFKIIKIIDDETIVINAGSENKVNPGDKFEIFDIGEEIRDPDTQEILGTLDTIKETVEAIHVFPKMCICKHRVITKHVSALSLGLETVSSKLLNIDSTEISGGLSSDLTIHIGDKVRKIK